MGSLFSPSKVNTSGTTTTKVELPDWANAGLSATGQRAQELMTQPAQTYGGDRVAGASPWFQWGGESVSGASTYQPGTVQAQQVQAQQVQPGSLAGMDLSGYQNPFEQQVVDSAISDIDRGTRQALARQAGAGVGAAGFGGFGDRAAVAGSEIERAGLDTMARTVSGLRQQGFARSQDLATTDLNRGMQGQLANQQTGLQAQLANQQTGLAAQQTNTQAGLQAAQLRASSGATLAGLAEVDRGVRQQGLDTAYETWREGVDDPFLKTQWAAGVLNGTAAPFRGQGSSAGNSSAPGPSMASQLLGAGTSAAGIYALLSEPNDKTDRRRLGTDPATGLGIWAYRYKGDGKGGPKVVGVMADEVEERYPHLVHRVGKHRVVDAQGLAALAEGRGQGERDYAVGGLLPGGLGLPGPGRLRLFDPMTEGGLGGARQEQSLRPIIDGVAEAVPMTANYEPTPWVPPEATALPAGGLGGPLFRGEADMAPADMAPMAEAPGTVEGSLPDDVARALERLRGAQAPARAAMPAASPVGVPEVRMARPDAEPAGYAPEPMPAAPAVGGAAVPATQADTRNWARRLGDSLTNPENAGGLALLQAGLGMMASRSPSVMTAVGEGGMAGIQAAMAMMPLARQRADEKALPELLRAIGSAVGDAPAAGAGSPAPGPSRPARPSGIRLRQAGTGAPAAEGSRPEGGGLARRQRTDAEFAAEVGPLAQSVAERLGVPASAVLAHWSLETNNGRAFAGANNLGNMTALASEDATEGGDRDGEGRPIRQRFLNFQSPDEFADRYVSWVQRRVPNIGEVGTDPLRYGEALRGAGYATDPRFGRSLAGVAQRFEGVTGGAGGEGEAPAAAPARAAPEGAPRQPQGEPTIAVAGRQLSRSDLLTLAAAQPGNVAVQRFVQTALPILDREVGRRDAAEERALARTENADLRRELAGARDRVLPTELSRLRQERDALPAGDPDRAAYDAAIRRSTGEATAERFTPQQLVGLRRDAQREARTEATALEFDSEADRTTWIQQRQREMMREWGADEAFSNARAGGAGGSPAALLADGSPRAEAPDAQPATGARVRPRGPVVRLSDQARTRLGEAGAMLDAYSSLADTFNDEYGGYVSGMVGDAANLIARSTPGESPRADWWAQYQEQKNLVRNRLFGSALTRTERGEFDKAAINPGMSADAIRNNLNRQREAATRAARRLAQSYVEGGFNRREIEAALGMPVPEAPAGRTRPGTDAPAPAQGAAPAGGAGGARPPLESFMR